MNKYSIVLAENSKVSLEEKEIELPLLDEKIL